MPRSTKSADTALRQAGPRSAKFADLIVAAREEKGWSRSDLARAIWGEIVREDGSRAARNRYTVTGWETGRHLPRPDKLQSIAEVLDIKVQALQDARFEDEKARSEGSLAAMSQPDIAVSSVTGRPDLVRVSAKVIVSVNDFPGLVQYLTEATTKAASEEA